MKNESFAMLTTKKKREKLIGVLNFKCNGLLSRDELERISDSIDHSRQYSVKLFFDSERFHALAEEENSRALSGNFMPKTVVRGADGDAVSQICILVPPERTIKAHRM